MIRFPTLRANVRESQNAANKASALVCPSFARNRPAFSLIELLIVIAIMAVVIGLLLSAVQLAREAAARTSCANNLKQLALGVQMYHENTATLPPGRIEDCWATWAVLLLPYVEQGVAYRSWDLSLRYYQQPDAARLVTVPAFFCPSRRNPGGFSLPNADARNQVPSYPHTPGALSDYAACGGSGSGMNEAVDTKGVFIRATTTWSMARNLRDCQVTSWHGDLTMQSIPDGLSNTIFLGEKHVRRGYFAKSLEDSAVFNGDHTYGYIRYAGRQTNKKGVQTALRPLASGLNDSVRPAQRFGSWHPGICQFAFGDGSVRPISNSIDIDTLTRLADRADGLPIGEF
jgi:prepilin-type N-terminal cleavage/methylation domain-containing protein